jgi:soluble lytic murein transglycosylase-like protein
MKNSKSFRDNVRRKAILALLSVSLLTAFQSADETSRKDPAPATGRTAASGTAEEKQKASVAAMMESIARQRASIERQTGESHADGFFTLAPPQHLSEQHFSETTRPPDCAPLSDSDVNALVGHAAKTEGLDPDLIRSVMKQESAFRPCAVSPKGARGLMQLMPATASELNVADPFDPASNVNGGAKFLKQLLDRYKGDVALALGAYNAGPANVDAANGIPKIPETINYVNQILGVLSNLNSAPGAGQQPTLPYDGLNLSQQMMNTLSH